MSSQLPAQIQLGEFTFDTVQRQLSLAGTVIVLEPKVYDLLCYLVQHSKRFVSLAELHQQVWAGRVVTDTAVRRTISKLRSALGDTDTDQPRYLKTQMKLGYQLICEVNADTSTELSENQFTDNKPTKNEPKAAADKKYSLFVAALLLFIVLVTAGYFFFSDKSESNLFAAQPEILLDVDGVMVNLSQSKDQRYLAFVGQLNNEQSWQLYLFDTKQNLLRKIATPAGQPRFVSFIAADTELAVTVFDQQQKASLYRVKLDGEDQFTSVAGLTGLDMLTAATTLDEHTILIGAVLPGSNSLFQYRLNLLSNDLEPFTYSQHRVEDSLPNLSPDGSKIALLRRNTLDNKMYLQLYDGNKTLVQEILLASEEGYYRFDWLNDQHILLRKNQYLELIDLATEQRKPVEEQDAIAAEFILAKNGSYSAIQRIVKHKQFYLGPWPYSGQYNTHFQLASAVSAVTFSHQDGVLWLTDKDDEDNWLLQHYYLATGQRSTIFSAKERFNLLSSHKTSPWLLLAQNGQLILLNQNTQQQQVVTTATQAVTQGVFSSDGQSVLYPAQLSGQWFIYQYQINTNTHQRLLANYKVLLPLDHGYIAIAADHSVEQLTADFSVVRVLFTPQQLEGQNARVFLNENRVSLVTQTTLSDYLVYTFDLDTTERFQGRLPLSSFGDEVSINSKGTQVLFSTGVSMKYQLVRGKYNFN